MAGPTGADTRIVEYAVKLVRAWYEDQHEDLLLSFRHLADAVNESGRLEQLYQELTTEQDEG